MDETIFTQAATQTFQNSNFRNEYLKLLKNEFLKDGEQLQEEHIKRLAETAALFSLSEEESHKKLALKIAVFLFNQYRTKYDILQWFAELVLARMGDLPTIKHMVEQEKVLDYFSFFKEEDYPVSYVQYPEILVRKAINQIEIGSDTFSFTDFQSNVFELLSDGKDVTFTAPTSAGKSFVVYQYITRRILTSEKFCAVYVVPTKSLISEIKDALTRRFKEAKIKPGEAMVFNSADHSKIDQIRAIRHKVIVVTQERLQQIVSDKINFDIALLVLDEAQKISDKKRGVIIEDAIREVIDKIPNIQKVIISPNIKDPERFPSIFDFQQKPSLLSTTKTPVGQNIFRVDFQNRSVSVSIYSQELDQTVPISDIPIPRKVQDNAVHYRKIWVAKELLKGDGHTLIYCNTPSECRRVARGLAGAEPVTLSQELQDAIRFLESHVHKQYYLVDYLGFGIGYHYGKMPQFVRVLVKKLFEKKRIDYLCCTSTLLEGVNLPAKNMILYKPKSGNLDIMDKASIMNLAGRAGRLGKDYYGNIYCIDYLTWKTEDAFDGELDTVKSALEKTLTDDIDDLIAHLNEYKSQGRGKKNIEVIATSLQIRQIRDPASRFLFRLQERCSIEPSKVEELLRLLKRNADSVIHIQETVLKNRSFDPRLQRELYDQLKASDELELPLRPSDMALPPLET